MKYLVAVIACNREPYVHIENEGARKTWAKTIPDGLELLYYYAEHGRTGIYGDKAYVDCEESYSHLEKKALLFFDLILKYPDLEYVFFTNLSSYVRLDKLLPMFQAINQPRYYAGHIGYAEGIRYASGSGFFISRELISFIYKNSHAIRKCCMGDVGYGDILTKNGVAITPMPRYDIESVAQAGTLKLEDVDRHFHFRCKQRHRHEDVTVMHKLHSLFHG